MSDRTAHVVDTDGMWDAVLGLAEQVEQAAIDAAAVEGLPDATGVTNVVVLGMGGSGIGGDVLQAVAAPTMAVPVVVSKHYELPAFVGPDSLVFASSFSGGTEETLEAAAAAADRGARMVALTTGGRLAELASQWGAPVFGLPPSIPHPRAAIGASSVPMLVCLERMGLLPGVSVDVAAAVDQLRLRRDALADARDVARRIGRTIPLVHSGGLLGAVAAYRWKCEFNENAKCPSFSAVQPELCHNEVTGWGQHGDVTRQVVTQVNLRHDFEHPQVTKRFAAVAKWTDEVVAGIVEVRAAGSGRLAQLFDLVLVGGVVSLEIAAHEGIDPGPIPILQELKAELAQR